jgi:hypothetical protein
MTLVNETGTAVYYWISASNMGDCGEIDVDGIADLPGYDNQQNVTVSFLPNNGQSYFEVVCGTTKTGEQVEMALVAE